MKHHAHKHLLVLNEIYIAKEGDVCSGCREQIDSCKSFVYSCSNISSTTSTSGTEENLCVKFLLHKTCAELPQEIVLPNNPKEFFIFDPFSFPWRRCLYCDSSVTGFSYFRNFKNVCFKCALFQVHQSKEDPKIEHPGHSHPLTLIQHPSSFKCYACRVNDNIGDFSYRCTKCQFWIHKSCGDAPKSFQSQFHDKHPLILFFSLPPDYHKFDYYCRICEERVNRKEWLYCCRSCRYFIHFQCARSSPMLRSSDDNETYPNLVHLPPADESSQKRLLDQFAKDTQYYSHNNSSIVFIETNLIKHWSHEEHDLKLISINELYHDQKIDEELLLLCEGCAKPIQTDDNSLLYGCVICKYFMHKVCAELPREVKHHLWPGKTLFANKYSEPYKIFWCAGCQVWYNGIFFRIDGSSIRLHIGCVTLPKIIKHEAHPHQLHQVYDPRPFDMCKSCAHIYRCTYRCKKCNIYICARCIMSARTIKHRWDPHPLDLIYDPGMVTDHEHEFDCEYCSREIDTNGWFYHCSICDLSFHIHCMYFIDCISGNREFPYIKFGASDIKRDKLHPHQLAFVLNKRVRHCGNCDNFILKDEPVLQCAPCNIMFCWVCYY